MFVGHSLFMPPYKANEGEKHIPLVLISGIMCNENLWARQIERFSSGNLHVLTPDILQEKTVEQLAIEIASSIEGRINIVGFSSGGYIAQEIIRLSPDKINKVILISTSGGKYTEKQQVRRKFFLSEDNDSKDESGLSMFVDKLTSSYTSMDDIHILNDINHMLTTIDPSVFYQQMKVIYEYNKSPPDLRNITMPALIICSDNDPFISCEAYIELVNKIPTAKLKLIKNSGHMLPLSAGDEINNEIEVFFGYPKFNRETQFRRI